MCGSISVPLFTGMGYDGILSSLLQMKHIYSLIDNQEMKGWTAAHLAALRNRAGCLAVLIGRAADVYTVTDKVMLAMIVAEEMMTKIIILCYQQKYIHAVTASVEHNKHINLST